MDIDGTAPATAEGELRIDASPEVVWSVISDLPNWPSWNQAIKSVDLHGPLEPGTTFVWKSTTTLRSTLQEVDPPREIAWTGVTMGIHAVHLFRFRADDGGTLARSEESWRGLIPSVLKGYSRKKLQAGIDGILASLIVEAERHAGV